MSTPGGRRGGFRALASGSTSAQSSDNPTEAASSDPTNTTTPSASTSASSSSRAGMASTTAVRTGTGAPPSRTAGTPGAAGAAATTPRAPVGRLQSLKKRGPTGVPVPLNPDGATPKPTLKYQPRAVARRSKEERLKIEQQEVEENKKRAADAAAIRRAHNAASGEGRGRGGGRGRGRGRGGGAGDARGGRAGFNSRNIKMEYGGSGRRSNTQSGVNSPASSDEDEIGGRFSIEQINIDSDEEDANADDEGKIKGKQPDRASTASKGMRPERLERHEHVERQVGVNTEAAASKSAQKKLEAERQAAGGGAEDEEESLFFRSEDDEDYESDQAEITNIRKVKGADETAQPGPRIKPEPDTDVTMVDDIPLAGSDQQPILPKKKGRKSKKVKDPRSQLQTEEERQEYDRYAQEVSELKRSLGTLTTEDTTAAQEEKPEGAELTEENKKRAIQRQEAEAIKAERQQRLFLVQFPPMTPNLVDPVKRAAANAGAGGAATDADAVQEIPNPGAGAAVKQESKESSPFITSSQSQPTSTPMISATQNKLPPGQAGKLQIHASGRATITWGGVRFELNKGSDVSFLQDAILMEEQKPLSGSATPSIVGAGTNAGREGPPEKSIWAMSQVSGKFVVTPDWDAML